MVEKEKKQEAKQKDICLVIMPFSDPQGYNQGHFRKIYDQILAPAIEMAGFTPMRIDENAESTMIHAKLLDQLINAPMVLCDLSSKNPNVLYELGIRHAFDKPVVLVQEKGQERIFDIAGLTTTEYRRERLYDEVVEDQKLIAEAIKQTSTAKKYSVMSLVNLDPAKISSTEQISEEDHMMLTLGQISRQVNRLEELVAKNQMPIDNVAVGYEKPRREVEYNLMAVADKAGMMLRRGNDPDIRYSPGMFRVAIQRLQDAIIDYQRVGYPDSAMIINAKEKLRELQMLEEKQKVLTGV